MTISKYGDKGWKDLNVRASSAKIREDNLKSQKEDADLQKRPGLKNPVLKGMMADGMRKGANPSRIIDRQVVPKDKPAITEDIKKSPELDKQREAARTKAEAEFQAARDSEKSLRNDVYKTSRPVAGEQQVPEKAQERQQKIGQQAESRVRIANKGAKDTVSQAKPDKTKAMQKAKKAKAETKKGKAKVDPKQIKKGKVKATEPGVETGRAAPRGEAGRHVTNQAAVAGGQQAGIEGDKKSKFEDPKKKIEKSDTQVTKGSGTQHTGPAEEKSTKGQLESLVGGSPFDKEPQTTTEIEGTENSYESIGESVLGTELYTNIEEFAASEAVRTKAKLNEKQVIKPIVEEVNYDDVDLSKKSIREKFYSETAELGAYAQSLVEQVVLNFNIRMNANGKGMHG